MLKDNRKHFPRDILFFGKGAVEWKADGFKMQSSLIWVNYVFDSRKLNIG
jgi:hypothetical protein